MNDPHECVRITFTPACSELQTMQYRTSTSNIHIYTQCIHNILYCQNNSRKHNDFFFFTLPSTHIPVYTPNPHITLFFPKIPSQILVSFSATIKTMGN